jgi:hypothetical protein
MQIRSSKCVPVAFFGLASAIGLVAALGLGDAVSIVRRESIAALPVIGILQPFFPIRGALGGLFASLTGWRTRPDLTEVLGYFA